MPDILIALYFQHIWHKRNSHNFTLETSQDEKPEPRNLIA
ncbi:hypothetical protein SAMN05660895_0555 [Thermoflavifilum thermophilum]|uniref:Uncharacterized protein n=1 Tax=Thermoflavifilum thermophilum TaxID=1393122 RepID=A0A1I7N467_9BACT|nr:hypothetical protein SAMN05660895_0555 [Thermoflavifilum thermophilum]